MADRDPYRDLLAERFGTDPATADERVQDIPRAEQVPVRLPRPSTTRRRAA